MGVINIDMQKIDESSLASSGMVIAAFQVVNKLGRSQLFLETFSLADIIIKVVLGMSFHTFSIAGVQFAEKKLTWTTYTNEKAFFTIRQVKIIDWKEFVKAALDGNVKGFVMHIIFLELMISIHLAREAQ